VAFYPPPACFGPPPYATIFVIYEGDLAWRNTIFGFDTFACENIHIYTHYGFAVCAADIPISDEKGPARSVRESLSQAVQTVVEAGLADPQRLGIFGHSYGGYTVNCAITGLDCFAAAVSSTGAVNLTSEYGRVSEDGTSFCGYFEQGQGKMGGPPWEKPERYIENSPLFQLNRVSTPVLIIHGDRDWNVSQAWELFSGLRRLGKTAELAIYEGEGHWQGEWRRANIIDRWNRVLAWFDKYLRPARGG
jgi:dipeptidyl aminopeptidase/acylaminoacyl peptidase